MGKHSIDQSHLDYNDRLIKCRDVVNNAIKEYVTIVTEHKNETDPYILGWGTYVEYVTKEDMIKDEGDTTTSVITPNGQPVTMTRGIFAIAQDRFTYPRSG